MNLWDAHNPQLELLRLNIPGGPRGWQPDRLIYRDFWHWRDSEIAFAHGRLALTGQNAGGKSSLLALAIPLLLDGDTSPLRLDPAQSRDRFLHWYLLGDDDADPNQPEAFRYEARTGYLALEFRHGETQRCLTIGMGIAAARNFPRKIKDWWGFIVPERRLGRDFDVRDAKGDCLGRREFQKMVESLGVGAIVTGERGEYRRLVNNYLFGMTEADYQALIGMLVQARRPKLGEQAGPEKVCELLRNSLPGVPAERLERVAEVVDNIEQYQRNLNDVSRRAEQVAELDRRLYDLAVALQQEAARQYEQLVGQYGNTVKQLNASKERLTAAEARLAELSERTQARRTRLAEIETKLAVFRQRDEANLTERLKVARDARARQEAARLGFTSREEAQRGEIQRAERRVEELADRFRARTRLLAQELAGLAAGARGAGWSDGATELSRSASDFDTLAVGDSPAEVEAVRPHPGLVAEARQRAGHYRQVAEQAAALARAADELRAVQARIAELRQQQATCLDAEARAEDAVDDRREELIAALVAWQEASPALAVSDVALAEVAEQVRALDAAPAGGAESLVEPIRRRAGERRRQLEAERAALALELAGAELRAQELAREAETLAREGLQPERSQLRARARAGGDLKPLYHWVRFRPDVAPDVAARVEAAALEAGLLDLLLIPSGADGDGAGAAAADAWAVSAPPAAGESLLAVLEPEPGAPPFVARVLASVGWGAGAGERWVAPDGNWRNGIARGQVGPWLADAPGLIGVERRADALARRLESLRAAEGAAVATRDALTGRHAELAELMGRLDAELAALSELPWQALFRALTELALRREQTAQAEGRLAAALPELDAAFARHREEEQKYERAAQAFPDAAGLSEEALRERTAALERLADRLQAFAARCGDISETMRDHREAVARRERERAILSEFAAGRAAAEQEIARIDGELAALQARLNDPDIAALQREIEELSREQQQLRDEEERAPEAISEAKSEIKTSRELIEQYAPQEEALRAELELRLNRLRQRLALHPALAEHAAALERESPVTAIRRLPKVVEAAVLEEEINRRRAAVQEYLHRTRDALADYRPTPDPAWETVTFYEERQQYDAAGLFTRLKQREEEYRRLIAEQEQELYERIIYQGILHELRKLIHQARAFTEKTNSKLKALALSSGERLALRFHAVEGVPGAKIGAALESMDQDVEWLSDERHEFLVALIRQEVGRVREEARARGELISYNDAIRQALDYRNWYEYQLLSQQPGSSGPVVVRSRGFGRRSTSAKAWALAVPVIAGVAARYDASPRPDAPRIVALDEAFAGFDQNNQTMYLKFLCDLNLSWIITCPDELPYSPALSAAMAYRMALDGNLHTAYPILWDGRRALEPLATEWEVAATEPTEGRGNDERSERN